MRKLPILAFMTLAIFISGCQQNKQPDLYTWNNYVKSSSDYGMKGHEKAVLEKHVAELEKIITDSEAKDKRVAPGIYAEYAQILFETNKKEEAKKYFDLEVKTYPESKIFMDRVMSKLYGEIK